MWFAGKDESTILAPVKALALEQTIRFIPQMSRWKLHPVWYWCARPSCRSSGAGDTPAHHLWEAKKGSICLREWHFPQADTSLSLKLWAGRSHRAPILRPPMNGPQKNNPPIAWMRANDGYLKADHLMRPCFFKAFSFSWNSFSQTFIKSSLPRYPGYK